MSATGKPNGTSDRNDAEIKLNLKFGESRRTVTLHAPTKLLPRTELLPILQHFENEVVALAEEETKRTGKVVSCQMGCAACCRQLIPVAECEADRLAELIENLPAERRNLIKQRIHDALAACESAGLRDRLPTACELSDEESRAAMGLDYNRVGIACPFLENESCSIYAERPLACREFLVTSPAVNCNDPGPDNIERVPLPANLSLALYRYGKDGNRQPSRWMPLLLVLEYAETQRHAPRGREDGVAFVQGFLKQLAPTPKGK